MTEKYLSTSDGRTYEVYQSGKKAVRYLRCLDCLTKSEPVVLVDGHLERLIQFKLMVKK